MLKREYQSSGVRGSLSVTPATLAFDLIQATPPIRPDDYWGSAAVRQKLDLYTAVGLKGPQRGP